MIVLSYFKLNTYRYQICQNEKKKLKSRKSLENIMAKFSILVFITSIKMTKNMNSSIEKVI